jgi:hypothetical protein
MQYGTGFEAIRENRSATDLRVQLFDITARDGRSFHERLVHRGSGGRRSRCWDSKLCRSRVLGVVEHAKRQSPRNLTLITSDSHLIRHFQSQFQFGSWPSEPRVTPVYQENRLNYTTPL